MNNVATSMVIIPGVVAFLLFLVFTYLYEQSRQQYFRAWQLGWGAYTLHFALDAWAIFGTVTYWSSYATQSLLVAMGLCIFISTRLMRERFRLRWYDAAIVVTGLALVWWNLHRYAPGAISHESSGPIVLRMENWLSLLLLYCAFDFFKYAQRKSSVAFGLLGTSVLMWAALMGFEQFHSPWVEMIGGVGHLLGPIPQMVLGISMVMVLFESERNAIQENALSFSTLGVDSSRLLNPEDLAPNMQGVLDRLAGPLHARRAVICITERWRSTLPSVQRGFSPEFINKLEKTGAGEYICELTYRRGGVFTFRNVAEMTEPLPAFPGSRFEQFRQVLTQENIRNVTAVSLQTRENNFGVVMFPHAERRMFGASNLRLLTGLALQIGLTLENYVVVHKTQRRTKEYELLTQIGQAISSHLDQDEVLRTIQKELGQIFDTTDFYVAFQEGDEIRFEYEVEQGRMLPKRSRKMDSGLTEYVIRTGQPLLIRSDLEETRKRLNTSYIPERPAKCFCAAPILLGGKPAGVMAVRNTEREFAFEQPDLEIMQTAAGQVSVAVENARLFAEEQRRSRQLAFINNISKTAISSEDSEQMLSEIVAEIQKNFRFDHIGIGIFDYATKDIEMKAEAGVTANSLGRRIPLGSGIVGRVARTGESALLQASGEGRLQGILEDARAVLCIPINYGESLMGVLNVESRREDAFTPQDVLIMKTLADLLATALHNAFVFQKLQTQSITDGLTGIKTRRFFWEALSSEWKRASRSGRPFSVVLVDLDKFKEVNDSMGHLEGDLVLARVGRLLEQKCRQSNVVARYGGDEFIILMPETGVEQAQVLAERLRLWLATDPMMSEHQITGSFGVASFPVHGYSAEDIIRQADAGMYVSKHAGGDRVSVAEEFSEGEASAVRRQLISGYIEGFLQREHTGPEHLDELVLTLKRMAAEDEENNVEVLQEAIEALAHAAEAREVGNSGHGEMTARYCEVIARALRLVPEEIADLSYTARVHNVGQLFVPDRVLNKSGPLTDDEFYLVKVHTRVGGEIVGTLPNSENMRKAIEHHHEAFDGSGYPNGLRGEEIPLWARILSLADAYVNMTTDRSFAPAKTSQQAMAELEKLSGTHFDGMLVRILARELKEEKPSWTGGAKI